MLCTSLQVSLVRLPRVVFSVGVAALLGLLATGLASYAGTANAGVVTLSAPDGYINYEPFGISGGTVLARANDPNNGYAQAFFTQTGATYNFLSAPDGYVNYEPIGISGGAVLARAADPNNDYAPAFFTQTGATSVPEIDPNSLGSVLALVLGSLGLLERRRLKAA